jgi:3-oxoacyl-[acyl-carrier protein] reductase
MASMSQQARTVLITGASSGIGAETARRLAGPGMNLVLTARAADTAAAARLASVGNACRGAGATVLTVPADLAEPSAGKAVIATALERFGSLNSIVSNAGFARRLGIAATDRTILAQSFDVIATAFLDLVQAGADALKSAEAPSVVAVSSFVAHRFRPDGLFVASAAAKAALEALVKSAAAELARSGITVNAVVPGFTRKDSEQHSAISAQAWEDARRRIPLGRLAQPSDIARVIIFLIGPDARYITGQVIAVDGGLSLG